MTQSESPGSNLSAGIFKIIQTWLAASPITCGLIALAASVVGVVMLVLTLTSGWDWLLDTLNLTPKATINASETIITGIENLGDFISVKYYFGSIDNPLEIRCHPAGIEMMHYIKYAATIEIVAATNLKTLTEGDVQYNEADDTYTIWLPQPRLKHCNFHDTQIDIYSQSVQRCWDTTERYDTDLATLIKYEFKKALLEPAQRDVILEAARTQNVTSLGAFFGAITGKTVTIEHKVEASVDDAECSPEMPSYWHRENAGYWIKP